MIKPQPLTKDKIEYSQLSDEHSVKLHDLKCAIEWMMQKVNKQPINYNSRLDYLEIIEEAFEGVWQ